MRALKEAEAAEQEPAELRKYDIYREEAQSAIAPSSMWKVRIDHKFTEQDFARFVVERQRLHSDSRLSLLQSLPAPTGAMDLDWVSTFWGALSVCRLGDYFTEPFRDLVVERLTEQGDLMEHFDIPRLMDQDSTKPLHNHAVPESGAYARVRLQVYWLALHVWLLHSKQHLLQETEGLWGSALCALITRRLFEWSWDNVRGWLHEADVPVMSLTGEVQDLQEYVFGFCVALDQAFKDEAGNGTLAALSLNDGELPEGCHGIATQVKHVLWANVYSGNCSHDASCLHELTVYVLRQRVFLEGLPRGEFFMGKWQWADFSSDSLNSSCLE